ncbi:DUF465 domain-containing protein [Desulfoplanes formicivorans]|uniref:DUF465 domain-containing protein n=1 Tax=Desulfoplanes formicivorans TaxID=1592317 RepID=A0A194ALI4_9BACT|nr:DUF465 domain-containing protein [Desulfoplanes formicivorans]GAU09524.1 hypothetical protein DPF_2251 [Desulfoplanes formicivorans]
MEQRDLELIAQYSETDEELKALWKEHLAFENYVEKMASKPFLTPEEDLELKNIKKQKLAGKTKMLALLEKHREQENK